MEEKKKKKRSYLSVNVFSKKVLIGDTIFTSPTEDGTAILRGHLSYGSSSHLRGKGSTFIFQLFWDPVYWSGPGNRARDFPLCSQTLYRLS